MKEFFCKLASWHLTTSLQIQGRSSTKIVWGGDARFEKMSVIMVGRHKKNRFCANGFESFVVFFLEILKKYSGFFLFVKIIYLLGHPTRESAFKYIFRKYQYGGGLLLESYLIMVKCYIYLI